MTSRFAACPLFAFGPLLASPVLGDTLQIIVDDAWSGATGAHFSGRQVERRVAPEAGRGATKTFYDNARLLLTSGEEGFVTWRAGGVEWRTRTDDDGYWTLAMNPGPALAPGWHEIESEPSASGPAGLLVVDPANRLGLISDIDDTIVVSEVLNKRVLLKNSLAVRPELRAAVPGMAELQERFAAQIVGVWIRRVHPDPARTRFAGQADLAELLP